MLLISTRASGQVLKCQEHSPVARGALHRIWLVRHFPAEAGGFGIRHVENGWVIDRLNNTYRSRTIGWKNIFEHNWYATTAWENCWTAVHGGALLVQLKPKRFYELWTSHTKIIKNLKRGFFLGFCWVLSAYSQTLLLIPCGHGGLHWPYRSGAVVLQRPKGSGQTVGWVNKENHVYRPDQNYIKCHLSKPPNHKHLYLNYPKNVAKLTSFARMSSWVPRKLIQPCTNQGVGGPLQAFVTCVILTYYATNLPTLKEEWAFCSPKTCLSYIILVNFYALSCMCRYIEWKPNGFWSLELPSWNCHAAVRLKE